MRFFRLLVRILLLCIGLVFLISCGRDISRQSLADIESILDSRPDSAMALIRQIDTASLRGKAARAKFSLLHAAALDKNYIDTADTRIAQPAVDWYDRHGTPEQRLKAWMYLGIEEFNGGIYNQAIVSFIRAMEQSSGIRDGNLLGILFSRMAETYIRTQEYNMADVYIDNAIKCFQECGRKDQENKELVIKATNLINLQEWEKGDSLFNVLINDTTFTVIQKGKIEALYAIAILSSPNKEDSWAYPHMSQALSLNGRLDNVDQYCAYAYLLSLSGKHEESDSVLKQCLDSKANNRYSYYYWKHRIQQSSGDYEGAYRSLWLAKQTYDSLYAANLARSAANAQRAYMETKAIETELQDQRQRGIILLIILFSTIMILLISVAVIRERRRHIEDQGRMSLIIDSLKMQLSEAQVENTLLDKKKAKARFSYLSDIFEDMYHLTEGGKEPSQEKLYQMINEQVNIVGRDSAARDKFEKALDKETGGIMSRFSRDFPGLTEQESRLASYVFAGFDNTTIMLLMGISTLEHARVKKNRLKKKIAESAVEAKDTYLIYFDTLK